MIDLHCHLLPGIDDGPSTMDDAVALCAAQVAAGVSRAAATPHVTFDLPTSAARAAAGRVELQAALDAAGIPLDVLAGGEIAITRAAELDEPELRALALGGGPWLLVESPLSPSAVGFVPVLHHLQARGHRLLLAHPERCPTFQRDVAALERLVHAGMLCQVTATAFTGIFGDTVRRFALDLAARGLVHDVSSDAHDALRRTPGLRDELLATGFGEAHITWWTETVPAAIVAGTPIPRGPGPAIPRPGARRAGGKRRWPFR